MSITLSGTFLFLYGIRLSVSGETHPLNSNSTYTRCTELITWKIGSVDSRYKIDEETLKDVMAEVSKLWSDAVGRKLVAYSDSGVVALNLIYTDKQKYTDDEQQMAERISEMRKKYTSMKLKFQQEFRELQNEQAQSSNRVREYAAKVNKSKKLSEELNDYADEVNKLIYQYENRFSFGKTFYQATYINVGDLQKINVYQFESTDKLRLVLAHEVGHILGLNHVNNPLAIMNSRMQFQNEKRLELTDEDIREIQNRCQS